ncbi:MAG: type II toxin-antitoxin system VapC family toxin [Bryobacteraceae bacterium]
MAVLVIDSSITAAWCFPDERTSYTQAVLYAIGKPIEAVAPRLWAYEIRNSVLMGLRRKRIDQTHAEEFLDTIRSLPVRLSDPVSYEAVFALADRHRLTVYDAAYLDLALREGLPLASLDKINTSCYGIRHRDIPAVTSWCSSNLTNGRLSGD